MSDDLREHAEKNCILELVTGSHLYGTNTPESDEDFVGIFMPPEEYVYGLKSVKEVDFSIKDKGEDGKNTADAVDRKMYEFRKFVTLALDSNPNVVEILYAPQSSILRMTGLGRDLMNMKDMFLSKMCVPKFLGYAKAQRHKMIIRRDHFNELRQGYYILDECVEHDKTTMAEVFNMESRMDDPDPTGPEEPSLVFWKKETGHHIHCGDICFEPGVYSKKAKKMLKERLNKATNRSELILKHGYDTKFASHLIRLLYECRTILEEKELIFPLPQAKQLLDIKNGVWNIVKVIAFAKKLEGMCEVLAETSTLQAKPRHKEIEEFTINATKRWLIGD
jgi:predicted nucleotidyltransferase